MRTLALDKTQLALICLGSVLLFVSAQIQIPIQPVPVTLQPTAVILLGLVFPKREAFSAVLAYLGLGALGLPMFAGFSAGYSVLIGPTAGYLVGFLAAVYFLSFAKNHIKSDSFLGLLGLSSLGVAIIYLFGISWLSVYVGPEQAFVLGFLPFVLPGIIKSFLLSSAIRYLRS